MSVSVTTPTRCLTHGLGSTLEHFAAIPRRRGLLRDPVFQANEQAIARVLGGWDWDFSALQTIDEVPDRDGAVRAVTWNVERGKQLDGVRETLAGHPHLRDPDLVLLVETDVGMGRSMNHHVPAELGKALGMGHVFCCHELLLSPGDAFERDHNEPNTLAMHGSALLTRWPVRRVTSVPLPEYRDKFHDSEKRLGGKRAVLAEVLVRGEPVCVVVVHLDPFASPRHRARQMALVVDAIENFGVRRVLVGGDFNTSTYHLGNKLGLALDASYKVGFLGFEKTIRHYMSPEKKFERRVFQTLGRAGLNIDGFNERGTGTVDYDFRDPELEDWTEQYLPRPVKRWLGRKLERYNGVVPMRLDWFAGRDLTPLEAVTVDCRVAGERVSDHRPLRVDVRL